MRTSYGNSFKNNPSVDSIANLFPYQIVLSIEKYEFESVIETSAAFLMISFKIGNKKLEGIEKPNIIKKIAKFKNESFKIDTNFTESPQNNGSADHSPQLNFKEKKAEFIIQLASSSSKSSKIDILSTMTLVFDLSTYLNKMILAIDETLAIKNSKYSGFLSFNIGFEPKYSLTGMLSDLRPSTVSKDLKRSKSITTFSEETKESPNKTKKDFDLTKSIPSVKSEKPKEEKAKLSRKFTAPMRSTIPKIVVKGPALDNVVQRFIAKSPDDFEHKLNNLLGSRLQTQEETGFLNRKLEVIALKEENDELKHENEKLTDERKTLLIALADLNEEKQTWFKCFQNQEKSRDSIKFEQEKKTNDNHINENVTVELLQKMKSFEERFINQEEKSIENIMKLKEENNFLATENKILNESLKSQNEEIVKLKNILANKEEEVQSKIDKFKILEEKYISSKEDIGHILNIILTNGNAEIMDLIEPYLKSNT